LEADLHLSDRLVVQGLETVMDSGLVMGLGSVMG
jgi:hypothetical protein